MVPHRSPPESYESNTVAKSYLYVIFLKKKVKGKNPYSTYHVRYTPYIITSILIHYCSFQTKGLVLIPEIDWSLFCEEWNVPEDKGISAEIVVASSLSKLDGSCENIPIFVEAIDEHMNEANDGTDVGKLLIKTYPQVNDK